MANLKVDVVVTTLSDISTRSLVEELKTREGVETNVIEPYQGGVVQVNGPATVLTIID